MSTRALIAIACTGTLAAAQPAPPAPAPAPEPTPAPAPAPQAEPAPPPPAPKPDDRKKQLNKQVENFDWEVRPEARQRAAARKIVRNRGIYAAASLAYATSAKIEVTSPTMEGKVDFPAVFGAELQAGYRIHPNLSLGVAAQTFFNLKPEEEDSAREVEIFAQATGYFAVTPQWDLSGFVAPGYSMLLVPDAEDARGLAFRWGLGPLFHVNEHIGFTAVFSHQLGFQRTERENRDVKMETSFFSLVAGIRLSL